MLTMVAACATIFIACLTLSGAAGLSRIRILGPYELRFYEEQEKYVDAKKNCERRNSRLVEIKSSLVQKEVSRGIANTENDYWIGATDKQNEGLWKWNDGSYLVYSNWKDDRPHSYWDGRSKDCAAISKISPHKWEDISCNNQRSYICQADRCKYHIDPQKESTFLGAQKSCHNINGTLAMVKDETTHHVITALANNKYREKYDNTYMWIGGRKRNDEWQWVDGTNVPMTNEEGFQKWQQASEACLIMSTWKQIKPWNDFDWYSKPCNDTENTFNYVCEVPGFSLCESCIHGVCISIGCQMKCVCEDGYFGYFCDRDLIKIYPEKENIIAIKGEIISINLGIISFDGPVSVDWYKKGSAKTSLSKTAENSTVTWEIGPVLESSEGTYIFRAFDQSSSYEKNANMNIVVHVPAEITDLFPESVVYQESSETSSVYCYAIGYPEPDITWKKDGNSIYKYKSSTSIYQDKNTVGRSILVLSQAKKSDAGNYTCEARNRIGRTSKLSVDEKITQVQLIVEVEVYRTQVTISMSGNRLAIQCTAIGFPAPSVAWYKGENMVFEDRISQATSNLYLKYSEKSHTGVYTCKASNMVEGKEYEASQNVTIIYPLTLIRRNPNTEDVKYNSTWASLSCTFEGYPKPDIHWEWRQGKRAFKQMPEINGSIFSATNSDNFSSGTYIVTTNLKISLARFLGTFNVTCGNKDEIGLFKFNENTYLHGDKHFYFSETNEINNADDSESYCRQIGGNLATIPDKDTNDFLDSQLGIDRNFNKLHIGGQRMIENGNRIWKWANGSFLYNESMHGRSNLPKYRILDGKYVGWRKDFPANDNDYNCLYLKYFYSYKYFWVNSMCSSILRFICEIPAEGMPTDVNVTSEECKPKIKVEWRPHPDSINITHRVSISAVNNNSSDRKDKIIPRSNELQESTFKNLPPSTKFIVKIKVCPAYCSNQLSKQYKVTTGSGILAHISHVNLIHDKENKSCSLFWDLDINGNQNVEKYKVTVSATFVYKLISASSQPNWHPKTSEKNFTISTMPNRNYSFQVVAINCAGPGREVEAVGDCITEPEGPPTIQKPEISDNFDDEGIVTMSFPFPGEENGPISCVFIIVEIGFGNTGEFSLDDLYDAQEAAHDKTMKERKRYIAIALSRISLEDTTIEIKIGTGEDSRCNVLNHNVTNKHKRSVDSNHEYEGQNHPIESGKEYSFSIVTSTPTSSGPVLKKSSPQVFKAKSTSPNLAWLIGLFVAILLLVCLISFVLYRIKQRQKNTNTTETMAVSMIPNRSRQELESAYVNVIVKEELLSKTDIKLEQLLEVYTSMLVNDCANFRRQFEEINSSDLSCLTTNAATDEIVKKKNRYRNILPYDQTRVILEGDDDYINACFVNGFRKPKKFIATQGPLPRTVEDFWKMILQTECKIVVMLTKCFEKGRKKCERYWPKCQTSVSFGDVEITNDEEAEIGSYIQRKLSIKLGGKIHTIKQFQFVRWPDHGVPSTTSGLIRFHQAVNNAHCSDGADAPVVVHCSAGAGRSGAFIGFDKLSEESESRNKVDIFNCVVEMRKQRMDMVQTLDQYILVHKLILEKCLFKNTMMKTDDLRAKLDGYSRSPNSNSITDEFNWLSSIGPMKAKKYGAEFTSMNRSQDVVPYEKNRVVVIYQPEDKKTPYINASVIEMYDDCTPLIAAQGPIQNTVSYFWRAVYDNDVNTIVMLTSVQAGNEDKCAKYWPDACGGNMTIGDMTITLNEEGKTEDHVTRRVFYLKRNNATKTVLHLQYTDWSSTACPGDALTIIKLIGILTSNVSSGEQKKGLIHCSDGVGRTGTFCAILNLIEQLKCEDCVDVFRAAKDLRDCRMGMINNIDQYAFCYRAVIDYVSSFSLYSNFE